MPWKSQNASILLSFFFFYFHLNNNNNDNDEIGYWPEQDIIILLRDYKYDYHYYYYYSVSLYRNALFKAKHEFYPCPRYKLSVHIYNLYEYWLFHLLSWWMLAVLSRLDKIWHFFLVSCFVCFLWGPYRLKSTCSWQWYNHSTKTTKLNYFTFVTLLTKFNVPQHYFCLETKREELYWLF